MIDIKTTINPPLKAKYRRPGKLEHRKFDPPEGTWTYKAGRFKSKTRTNSPRIKLHTLKSRRRAYGPW